MASTSKQSDSVMSSEEAIPYEQEFDTEVEKEVKCDGIKFAQVKSNEGVDLCTMKWGRVPFDMELERIKVEDNTHKDLILNVFCNRKAHDPHWRCAFTVTVLCNLDTQHKWESAEQSMTATKGFNSLIVPILRLTEYTEHSASATLKIKIKINSYAGHCPAMIKSFTNKTTISDATLMVEGRRLYVSRAILAMHSTYFHTLFYDHRFTDAARQEFDVSDVSLNDMNIFLNLIYPNVTDDRPIPITSADTIEAMLTLSERFGADCVKRLMEKYLMGEMDGHIEGFSLARRLLISDRFRLSAPSSMIMNELRNDRALRRLGETEEYNELSESIRAAILDMRVRSMDEESEETKNRKRRIDEKFESFAADRAAERLELEDRVRFVRSLERLTSPIILRPPLYVHSPSSSSSSPRDRSYTHFRDDVGRLEGVYQSFATTSAQASALNQSMAFLRNWSRAEYDLASSALRIPLHGVMVTLITAATQGAHSLVGATIDRFITLVDSVRDSQIQLASMRKRKRPTGN